MLTGKRPTDPMFQDGLDIVSFVESNLLHQIDEIIDPHLVEECKDSAQGTSAVAENAVKQPMVSLLQVALSCARTSPSERMHMKQVATKMHAIKTSYLGLKAKTHSSLEII